MASVEERQDRIEVKLDSLINTVATARGGLKTILAVAAAGSAIGASVVKLIGMLKGGAS